MVSFRSRCFAEGDLLRIPAEIGVEGYGNEMPGDILRLNLDTGEPPGAVGGAGASGAAERASVRGGEDHQRLSLRHRAAARFGDVR